jgi:drug/metabolite transporter (DMT)-like permease
MTPRTSAPPAPDHAPRFKVLLAFACVYLIWGSTYLAIRWVVEVWPPFLTAGARFLTAGAVLVAWGMARGARWPRPAQWRASALTGSLMLLGGNGAVVWSEQRVPSGLVALMVSCVPLWMALLQGLGGGARAGARTWVGVFIGLGGIAILVGPHSFAGGERLDLWAAGALMLGSLSWSAGSVLASRLTLPVPPILASGLQMLSGGVLLTLLGVATGEPARLAGAPLEPRALLSLGYLIVFGSIIGFNAYVWLLGVVAPSRVATYAFVNPVVAVLLGWAMAGEPLTARTLLASAVIVGAVALITFAKRRPMMPLAEEPPA